MIILTNGGESMKMCTVLSRNKLAIIFTFSTTCYVWKALNSPVIFLAIVCYDISSRCAEWPFECDSRIY